MRLQQKKKYALIIPDGGGDVYRNEGRSPLAMAHIPYSDFLASEGVAGVMQTLYPDLPKESIVAQLGMLGWDPHLYYPNGRASCELLALEDIYLQEGDLAFRANLVRMEGRVLVSYNADYIFSEQSLPLIEKLNKELRQEFPDFELYHNSDFRNTLVMRGVGLEPIDLRCPEPHENHQVEFDVANLISGKSVAGCAVAARLNQYLSRSAQLLRSDAANMLFPWSPSKSFHLPAFKENTGFEGKTALVGCMDFLHGIAKAGALDFFKVGNGRPDTDYQAKGAKTVELFSDGYDFVICHVNGPDEASHMGDLKLKIKSLEELDKFIVRPVVEYFQSHPDELGGVMIVPDHYTNHTAASGDNTRVEAHSSHPVPFALWNGRERDEARYYSEDDVLLGKYAQEPINHLELLRALGVWSADREKVAGENVMTQPHQDADGTNIGNEPHDAPDDFYVFPASFAQQRLWFLHQLEPESASYNISKAMRLAGELNVGVFARSLNEIIRRHEILRTTFAMLGGRPMQLISEHQPITLPLIDLSTLAPAERERQSRRLATEEAQRPFNLRRGPLLRATLLRLAPDEHLALFTMHHIVSDAWSVGVFIREFTALYTAFKAAEQSPLPELPIQYADYAQWQREWLQGEVLEKQLSYWGGQLAGAPAVIELPTDHARPSMQSDNGAKVSCDLGTELLSRLKELSQRENVTLFMTLLAAWQVLLYRYSGQDQVCVGTPVAGRTRAETEDLIGFFINTLVLRTDLSGNPTFIELLERVREVCLGAYAHQDIPFERLVEQLQPERSLSHSPLFQVMFTLQNAPGEALDLPELRLSRVSTETRTAKFDLTLSLSEASDSLAGAIEYNTDLFDEETISRMLGHFHHLLTAIAADPQRLVRDLPLLPDSERQQLLVEFNDTRTDFPQGLCLHQLFEEQVARTPESVALVFEDQALSYQELNARANQLAHRLRKLGVQAESRVGILLERSIEMVVSLLAVLKAGGAYVPLDPEYPGERVRFMLEDAEVCVLVTQEKLRQLLPGYEGQVLCLEAAQAEIALESEENVASGVVPENLAYVIYTSGSTGTPKGAMNTHRAICNRLLWMQAAYHLEAEDRVLQKTPFSFDVSVWEFFWPLLVGARLVMARVGGHRDSAYLVEEIVRSGITTLHFVPSMLRAFLGEAGLAGCRSLRRVISSGEELPGEVAEQLLGRVRWAQLHNLYGPTEAAVDVTAWECQREWSGETVPIGRPIWNTQVHVLGREMELVPVGVSGELYIGGEGVARGYLGRAELTADRFVPDPYGTQRGARLYRTGDVVRRQADGTLLYLGRADQQVKVRGYRIELGEIEAVLREQAGVRECVVVAAPHSSGSSRLTAYVVLDTPDSFSVPALRNQLLLRLPEYMIPSSFLQLQSLPLSPNGKLDRRALPDPDHLRPALDTAAVAPTSATEVTLSAIWAEVLGLTELGIHDNFFELGGDSILSIQIVARANQAGLRLAPKHLFQYQTVAELALVADEAAVAQPLSSRTPARAEVAGAPPREVALTPIQRWFFEQNFVRPHHWNQSLLLEVRQAISGAALSLVVRRLVRRHEALRLRFVREGGNWRQSVSAAEASSAAPPLSEIDLSELEASAQSAALERAAGQAQASLDLSAGPLLRVVLFELGAGRAQRLLMVAHHLVTDGVSWRILLEELRAGYVEAAGQGASEVQEGEAAEGEAGSFAAWAERLSEYALSAEVQGQVGYWGEVERAAAKFRLPRDLEGAGRGEEGETRQVSVELTVEETRGLLQEVPRAYRTRINEVLLTALGRALSRWSGRRQVAVEMEGHGREEIAEGVGAQVQGAMGWFTSLYPVVLEAEWGEVGEGLKEVKEQVRGVPGGGLGYGLLRYLKGEAQESGRAESEGGASQRAASEAAGGGGEVLFNYLGQLDNVLEDDGLFVPAAESAGERIYGGNQRPFKLSVVGSVRGGKLAMTWKYSPNVHHHETIKRVADDYIESLKAIIDHCRSAEAGNFTPSDFPTVNLSQQQLDKIISKVSKARLS